MDLKLSPAEFSIYLVAPTLNMGTSLWEGPRSLQPDCIYPDWFLALCKEALHLKEQGIRHSSKY